MLNQSIGPYVKAIFKRNFTDKTRFSKEKVSCDCLISPVQISASEHQQRNSTRTLNIPNALLLGLRHFIELVCFY